MIKWFHFNWMDAKSAGAAVTVKNYFAAFTPSGIKETSLTLFQFALMGGDVTLNPVIRSAVPVSGGMIWID
ncbi:hypothetical protein [uncultured Amphritea sp.]|uniref:hypothetical protein n=1 Tax=Amphritea sp. TaxID=1872502 RepID=UPI0025D5917D|nr:hypothetical protein [uncultured Amphritea sp.]